jgi:hypothetical protein
MPPLPSERLTRLAVVNQQRMSAYAKQIANTYGRTFKVLGGADGEAERAWGRFAGPTMQATQRHVVRTQQSYVNLMARGLGLEHGEPIDPDELVGSLADLADRYASPIIDVRALLGQGMQFLDALDQASRHASELARDDVADTTRDSATAAMDNTDGIVAYRRVPSDNACPFCLIVAGQTYHTDDLAPAHNNCTCGVAPVTDENDPTLARQAAMAKDVYANKSLVEDAQSTAASLDTSVPTEEPNTSEGAA